MKFKTHLPLALLALSFMGSVHAQGVQMGSGYYGEVGYLGLQFKNEDTKITPKLMRFVIGKELAPNLSIEAMAGVTVAKESWTRENGRENGDFSGNTYGIYVKPKVEIAKDTEAFARLGIARTSWKDKGNGGVFDDAATKLAYGLGLQTKFTKDIYGQIDYMHYAKGDNWKAHGLTFSVGLHF